MNSFKKSPRRNPCVKTTKTTLTVLAGNHQTLWWLSHRRWEPTLNWDPVPHHQPGSMKQKPHLQLLYLFILYIWLIFSHCRLSSITSAIFSSYNIVEFGTPSVRKFSLIETGCLILFVFATVCSGTYPLGFRIQRNRWINSLYSQKCSFVLLSFSSLK